MKFKTPEYFGEEGKEEGWRRKNLAPHTGGGGEGRG